MFCLRRNIELYPDFDRISYAIVRLGSFEKQTKTIYIDKRAFKADNLTGEVLRPKFSEEIKRCYNVSLQRCRKNFKRIVLSNNWKYFVTLTFNPDETNPLSDSETKNRFDSFRRYLKRKFPNVFYMLVSERHEKGGIHFHLVLGGCDMADLNCVFSGHYTKVSKIARSRGVTPKKIYNITAWKFGFSTLTEIESQKKVASYIMKYIGKDIGNTESFKKRYWSSKNVLKPENIIEDLEIEIHSKKKNISKREIINNHLNMKKVAINDIADNLFNYIEYYDGSQNYCVRVNKDKSVIYEKFINKFVENSVISLLPYRKIAV